MNIGFVLDRDQQAEAGLRFVHFNDPVGNTRTLQELPDYSKGPYATQN